MVKKAEYINIGGMFRCCLDTIDRDCAARDKPREEGATVLCVHCNRPIHYQDNTWSVWRKGPIQ